MGIKQTQTIFALASELDGICVLLEELELLLQLLDGEMEQGYGVEEQGCESQAVLFLRRLPVRQALLRTIQRELHLRLGELNGVGEDLYQMQRKCAL